MNTLPSRLRLARVRRLVSLAFALLVPSGVDVGWRVAAAESPGAPTGTVIGRVQNEVTNQYLTRARVTVKGTDLTAFTDESGTYRLAEVPAGPVVLEVFYSGLDPQQTTVTMAPGQTLERDFNLTSRARYGDKVDVVKLDPFVTASSRLNEGDALATNEQRFASNIKNVVATDAFGDVIEGNVAEFMRYLPGITVDYSDVMPLAVSVRGFDPNMTNVTTDGASLANASRNATSRQFDFMQVSINNISRVEVTKVPTPANPASGISGSVNMVSKSAFERSRAQLNYRLFVSASSDGMMLKEQPFPYDTYEPRVNPGFDFDYTLPITKDFGIVLTALTSKAWNEQNISQMTWNGTAAGTGATPAAPFLQTHNIVDAPKWYERYSTGLKADWRVSRNSVLSLGLQATYYKDTNGNVQRAAGVGTAATSTPAGGVPLTFSESFARSATGRGTVTYGGGTFHIDARTLGSNLRYRFENADWRIDAGANASTSKTWLRAQEKGSFQSLQIGLLETVGVRVNLDDIRPEGPKSIRAFNSSNREIDLFDPRSFRLNTATSTYRDHRDDSFGGELNVRRNLKLLEVPLALQVGGSYKSQDRDHRSFTRVYTYNPANPADPTVVPFVMQVYKNRQNYFDYDYIPWISPNRAVEAWGKNPALFTRTAAQLVTEEQTRITNSQGLTEITSALYVQGEARFFHNRLTALTGVRFEKVNDVGAGPLFEPGNAFVRNPNGTFARNAAGARIRRPEAGAAGSMEELLLTRKERGNQVDRTDQGYYPSLHLNYNATDRLLFRAAFAKTYGPPDFNNLIPNATISENDVLENADPSVVRGTITVTNPGLKPWTADNYDFSAEYYTDTGGLFSAGVFRKEIKNFFGTRVALATAADLEELGLDPRYVGWQLTTTLNVGDARVTGGEFNVRQSLSPLGAWGRYFSVFANATKLKLEGSALASFTKFMPENVNWGATFTKNPVTFMLKWNGRGEQKNTATPALAADAFQYSEKRTTMDLNATYQITRWLSLFANGRNILNVHYNLLRYGAQTPGYAKRSSTNSYGVQWAFGLKGTF